MLILSQFILRLCFGLALAMALTPPRRVTSGYYRNHSYVLLGLSVLATMAALSRPAELRLWPPLAAVALSYFSSAVWLYEKRGIGIAALASLAAISLVGACLPIATHAPASAATIGLLDWLGPPSSGLLLGATLAAMFLGHWYLNTPSMELAPLRRLVLLMGAAIALRMLVCGAALFLEVGAGWEPRGMQLWLLALRWAAGLLGAALLAWMAWQTLKIPNTQSATGILYVAVIGTFLGELSSLLLSQESRFPL